MRSIYVSAAFAIVIACALPASAGTEAKVGSPMPDFTLPDLMGETHSLSDYKGKLVVLEFMSQNCPWSRGTDPHINALAEKYGAKEVVFLGIDSDYTNTPEDIAKHAEKAGIDFPILKDKANKYADVVGATRTPEMYVVNPEGVLVYHGAFDDRGTPNKKGATNYVAKALDDLLAGNEVETSEVKAWGCAIKRVSEEG